MVSRYNGTNTFMSLLTLRYLACDTSSFHIPSLPSGVIYLPEIILIYIRVMQWSIFDPGSHTDIKIMQTYNVVSVYTDGPNCV